MKPYGGTFMCFADYARGAIRLSALMKQPVTYVLTHDSIGLGEDGPTHQPVEHLAMLRATPNVNVFRPADAIETIEAWELSIGSKTTPNILALSRQKLPTLRTKHMRKNQVSFGAYILSEALNKRKAILLATGSEVKIAMSAKSILEEQGIGVRVVSMPCWELFEKQDDAYRRKVLPFGPVRVGVEAGVSFGWERWLSGERGKSAKSEFIGMKGFGASAPAEELYDHFQITSAAIVSKVLSLLG
jgi:transketolase